LTSGRVYVQPTTLLDWHSLAAVCRVKVIIIRFPLHSGDTTSNGASVTVAKVLIHSLVFAPDGVSTAYIMTDLASELSRLGHAVTVLTTTPHYNLEPAATAAYQMTPVGRGVFQGRVGEVLVWHLSMPMKGDKVATRMADYIRFHLRSLWLAGTRFGKFDVVIAPSPPLTMGLVAAALGLMTRAPSIYNLQELFPDAAVNDGLLRNRAMIAFMHLLERAVYTASARVVTISNAFADVLRARSVPDRKIVVIPNFVDTNLYRPRERRNPFATNNGLADDFVVLYAGNLGKTQDWESFLYAAESLRSRPITFAVSGDGLKGDWLRSEVERRSLTKVKLLGYLPRHQTPLLYASSDIGIIPMKARATIDTFPSKVYTHFACAKPAIVSADEGSELKRVIRESGCGSVVPPDDPKALTSAIQQAFERRDSLAAEGAKGRAFVEKTYSKEAVAARYSALIEDLL
jgi:colanic acid biosynthesis glycosyl transferase WcaI